MSDNKRIFFSFPRRFRGKCISYNPVSVAIPLEAQVCKLLQCLNVTQIGVLKEQAEVREVKVARDEDQTEIIPFSN